MKKLFVVALFLGFVFQASSVWAQTAGLPPSGGVLVQSPIGGGATFNGQQFVNPIFTLVPGSGGKYWLQVHFVVSPVVLNTTPVNINGVPYLPNVKFQLFLGFRDQRLPVVNYYESHVTAVALLADQKPQKQIYYNVYFFLPPEVIKDQDYTTQIIKNPGQIFNYALLISVDGVQQTAQQYTTYLFSLTNQALRDQFVAAAQIGSLQNIGELIPTSQMSVRDQGLIHPLIEPNYAPAYLPFVFP